MLGQNSKSWYQRRGVKIAGAVLVLAAIVFGCVRWFSAKGNGVVVSAATAIPSAAVIRGELVDVVELRGQIRPLHSVDLLAPPDSGQIQILKLVKDGDTVKKGDVAIVFDPSTIQMTLSQRQSDLKQAEAQIDDMRAKQKLAEQQDQTDLLKAKYDVERAKLDRNQKFFLRLTVKKRNCFWPTPNSARSKLNKRRIPMSPAIKRTFPISCRSAKKRCATCSTGKKRSRISQFSRRRTAWFT
jgi:multidrug efflux pump subunit AcrA (membrane-fusion protein)